MRHKYQGEAMLSLLLVIACTGETKEEITPTPKNNTEQVMKGGNAGQNNMVGNAGGERPLGAPGNGEGGVPMGEGSENIGDPGPPPVGGENIGDPNLPAEGSVPPSDGGNGSPMGDGGENIGDPGPPPEGGGEMTNMEPPLNDGQEGGATEPKKVPPTFIYNSQSQDSGSLYKAEDETCFVRINWDQPAAGELGPTEERDCPQQMAGDHWKSCTAGRLVKHNVGDLEGTCQCEPVEGEPKAVDCPK